MFLSNKVTINFWNFLKCFSFLICRMVLSMMNMETVNSTKAREKIILEDTTAGTVIQNQ